LSPGVVYFPDWGGNLWALNARRGKAIWHISFILRPARQDRVADEPGGSKRHSLYRHAEGCDAAGDKRGNRKAEMENPGRPASDGDRDRFTGGNGGRRLCRRVLARRILAFSSSYKCCSFRGSAVAFNATTGKMKWKTFTAPEGYTGAGVWAATR